MPSRARDANRVRPRKPCTRCGGPKEPGKAVRLCAKCRAAVEERKHEAWQRGYEKYRRPCEKCGGVKPPGRSRHYCDDCMELAQWRAERRQQARNAVKRRPCIECGGVKPPGTGRLLCDRCKAARDIPPEHNCVGCAQPILGRPLRASYCFACLHERQRKQRRDSAIRARLSPGSRPRKQPKRARKRAAAARAKREERLAKDLDFRFPSFPLAVFIHQRAGVPHPADLASPRYDELIAGVCRDLGVDPRVLYGWRIGERLTIRFYEALDILTRADVNWWDVWNEANLRQYAVTVRVYTIRHRPSRSVRPDLVARGDAKMRHRQPHHMTCRVDIGPDRDTLALVTAAMSSDPDVAQEAARVHVDRRREARIMNRTAARELMTGEWRDRLQADVEDVPPLPSTRELVAA